MSKCGHGLVNAFPEKCPWCIIDRLTTELRESAKRADLWKDRESATQAKYEAVCYERDTLKDAMETISKRGCISVALSDLLDPLPIPDDGCRCASCIATDALKEVE